ncbi:MAG: hypothetical protein HUU57_17190 [Bdellovibrio sp.]|nr:hypothetical protein [Bdellovibrio sp.]
MRKLLIAVSMLLTCSSAFAKSVEPPFLVCQTEDKRSWVEVSLIKENNQYEIQANPITSSPFTVNMQYWSVGKIPKQSAELIKKTFTRNAIAEKNLPLELTADAGTRITSYNLAITAEGEIVTIIAGYYGDSLKNYVQLVNCVLPKK